MFSSVEEANYLVQLIRKEGDFNDAERQGWLNLLQWMKKGDRVRVARPSYAALDGLRDTTETEDIPHRPFIAVLPDAVFDRLYPENDDGWASSAADFDVATGATVSLSPLLAHIQSVAARESYSVGTEREVVWEELLRPLASQSKQVTLFDRYVFAELYRRKSAGNPAAEHLAWLLDKLSMHAPAGTLVKVYGATGYGNGQTAVPRSAATVAQLLNQRWTPSGNRLAGVELVSLETVQSFPHDRHTAFGETTALELPSGLDRLAPSRLRGPFTFGYKWKHEQLQSLRDRVSAVEHQRPFVTRLL